MDILRVCVQEIALSGLEGCTMAELWQHLSCRQPPLSVTVDEPMKAFIWDQMKETVLQSGSVGVYQLAQPRTPPTSLTESQILHGLNLMKYKHPFPYRPINREDGVRGSCSTYKARKEITETILSANTDLENLSDVYGDSAVLVASQEVRERILLREDSCTHRDMSLVQYCILEVVGASRHHGILRNDLTKKILKIDPRSTFHHCRTLEGFGLLKVTGSKRNSIELIHLLILPSYPLPPWLLEANYPSLITSMLLGAPSHTLPTSIVSSAFGKGFKSCRNLLIKGGYVESVLLPKPPALMKTKPVVAGKVSKVWHLRLLKPFTVTEEEEEVGGEGEREEEGGGEECAATPIVFEMPIDMQGYRVIDKSGPRGINNSIFCESGLQIDVLCARQLSKALIKSKNIVTILIDEAGVKKIRLVAARHIQKNKDYEQLLAEQARSSFSQGDLGIRTGCAMFTDSVERYRDKKRARRSESIVSSVGRASLGGVSDNDEAGGGASEEKGGGASVPVPYCVPGPSGIGHGNETQPSPSSMMELKSGTSKSFKKRKQLLTYNQLKRLNVISKYVEEKEIVVGVNDILEHIRQCEKLEGRLQMVDRKTTEKCVAYLVASKKLCHKNVTVPDLPQHKLPSVIFAPGVSPEKLEAAEEKLMLTAREANVKKESKLEARERKRRRKEEAEEEEEAEGDEEEEESDVGDETAVVPEMARTSKFQRLKRLHFFLWGLAYGIGETTPTVGSKVKAANGDVEDEGALTSETVTTSALPPITNNYPWVTMVTQLPQNRRGPGWLSYNDIIPNMPLSLFTFLMPTLAGGQTIPARYLDYFSLPDLTHTPIGRLPRRLRGAAQSERRDVSLVNQLLERLVEIGLVRAEGNIQTNKKREQVYVHLERSKTILDTTVCVPRRSFFLEEARSLFKPVICTLTSLTACERFWYQLQTICLRTPIILVERTRPSKKRKKATPTPSSTNDLHSLTYTLRNTRITTKIARKFNEQGFGAGGLPPLTFSHLPRNWCGSSHRDEDDGGGMGIGECGMGVRNGEGGMEWSYGPGMALGGLDAGEVDGEEGKEGGGEETSAPPHKRTCVGQRPHPQRVGVVHIPSHQIQRYSGGRGFTRVRSKRALETARKLKKVKNANSRYSVLAKSAVLVMDGATKKDREMVAVKTHRERVRWLPHEDSFLLLAYLASHALRQVTGEATVSYRQIRDSLHAEYPTSRDKSMDAVLRRVSKLRKRRKALSATVNVCLAEILSEIQGMGSSAPEPTFPSLLSFVTQRYSSHGGLLLGRGSTLPSSLSELRSDYDVVGWHSEAETDAVEETEDDGHTLNHALLTDLIIACLGAEESNYDHYSAFKIFETFPEEDVEIAFDQLKSRYLIRRRRQTVGGGPLQCQSFQLATNFNSKLEGGYFIGTGKAAEEFAGNLAGKRSKVAEDLKKRLQLPSDELAAGALELGMEVESGTVSGGIVLSLVSTLFAEEMVCEPVLPERLFETDDEQDTEKRAAQQKQLVEGALDEEREGGEGEGRDETEEEEKGGRKEVQKQGEREETVEKGEGDRAGKDGKDGQGEERREGDTNAAGEMEGEEEDEDEGEGEKCTSRDVRYSGTGVSSLLRVGDNSTQNHGTLTLDLNLPWSSLLDPLPDEVTPPSLVTWAEETPPDSDTPLSLDAYLSMCREHLSMSDGEACFNGEMYRCVEAGGERGRREEELQTLLPPLPPTSSLSLTDYVQRLLNFEMVVKVSSRLVAAVHAKRWCMPVSSPHSTSPADLVPYRPWVTVNSAHPNETMMRRYREGVLTFIRSTPGATLRQVLEHFSGMLHWSALCQILQSLESEQVIVLHSLAVAPDHELDQRAVYCLPAL